MYNGFYQVFTGDGCIRLMLNFLTGLNNNDKIILNAFNGANFDHRFMLTEIIKGRGQARRQYTKLHKRL